MHKQREPLGAALASLSVDTKPFKAKEYDAISQRLVLLRPFHKATIELLKHFIASQCGQTDQGAHGAILAKN